MNDYELVQQLIGLVRRLYDESAGFHDIPEDQQLWYNRGYANGMARELERAGYGCRLREQVDPDPEDIIEGQQLTPWGRAYGHGLEMGECQCLEALSK